MWRARLYKTGDTGVFPNTNADADTIPMMVKLELVLTKLDNVGKMLVKYIFNFQKS